MSGVQQPVASSPGQAARRLAVEYVAARALAECANLGDAVPRILEAICQALDWEYGALWNVDRDANFPRAAIAATEGLHGGFGFPILLKDETLGIMEFFSREIREPGDDLLRMLETVGRMIGQFMERRRAEEELPRHAEQLAQLVKELELACQPSSGLPLP